MIKVGSTAVIRTRSASYSTCQIISMSASHITVKYVSGMSRDKITGEYRPVVKVDAIPHKDIIRMSERV